MLIKQTKVIILAGQRVKLYSLDGRTWVSQPHDLTVYKQRFIREKLTCQKQFYYGFLPDYVPTTADFRG